MKRLFPSLFSAINEKLGNFKKNHQTTTEAEKETEQSRKNENREPVSRNMIENEDPEKAVREVQEKADRLKHQFMANMSHEIRTPMNAIVGMSRLLLEKNPNSEQLKYLNAIQLSANNLMSIISDILDLTKIEAGKITIEHEDFTFRELLQSIQDMFMLKAEEKHIELRIVTEKRIPARLNGDAGRLNQILINLVGNAIKFTDKGFIELNTTVVSDAEQLMLQFDIIDTGIGIAANNLESIFDSFIQEGMDSTRKFGGTGLGLTISKELTNLMGGTIAVKSILGKGTTFTVQLPFVKSAVQEIAVPDAHATIPVTKSLNNLKVLLVEDNDFNRLVAVDTLTENLTNVSIDQAVNGEEAVNMVKNNPYDIVLMDIQMPVMDGVTATKIIRNILTEPARSIKILALTANVMQEDLVKYFDVGIDDYVAKPFQVDELLGKMEALLAKSPHPRVADAYKEEAEHEAKEVKKRKPTPSERSLPEFVTDKDFLKQFTGGNPERMRKYVKMFMENATRLLISMDLALQAKDYGAIKIAAHSLKPQLSYIGVKEDVSHIFMIEQSAGSSAHYENLEDEILALNKVVNKAFEELKHLV